MKKLLALLLALGLLAGCTAAPKGSTGGASPFPEPTTFLYDPQSYIEDVTDGALRAYPLEGSTATGIRFMGDTLVLFTMDDQVELTTVHLLQGDRLGIVKSANLDCALYPGDAHLQVTKTGMRYYNPAENAMIFLDTTLTEVRRVRLPSQISDAPVLSADGKSLYFSQGTGLYVMDAETGVARLLRENNCAQQSVVGLHFGDSLLELFVTTEDGSSYVAFLSTENGETLGTDRTLLSLDSRGKQFLLQRLDGVTLEILSGSRDGEMELLSPRSADLVFPCLSINAVAAGTGSTLELYDLGSGEIIARADFGQDATLYEAVADPSGKFLWVRGFDKATQAHTLYRWDLKKTEAVEERSYLGPRYTAAAPDTQGLEAAQAQADALGEKYGITVTLGTGISAPEGYSFDYEHQVPACLDALDQLESALALLPEGFLSQVAQLSKSGTLHVNLVRAAYDRTGAPVPDKTGLHYVLGGDQHMALTAGDDLETAFLHQLCHVADGFVYGGSKAYDTWETLSPEGFAYFASYSYDPVAETDPLLTGDTRAFLTAHGMTFPKEDRAELFCAALAPGNETLFANPLLQAKLRQLCLGLREAMGLAKTEADLPWEQYLQESIVRKR